MFPTGQCLQYVAASHVSPRMGSVEDVVRPGLLPPLEGVLPPRPGLGDVHALGHQETVRQGVQGGPAALISKTKQFAPKEKGGNLVRDRMTDSRACYSVTLTRLGPAGHDVLPDTAECCGGHVCTPTGNAWERKTQVLCQLNRRCLGEKSQPETFGC